MEAINQIKNIFQIIGLSLKDFRNKNPLQLASSTAFFTLFALPPILIILSSILGTLIKPELLSGEIFEALTTVLGANSSLAVKTIFLNFQSLANNTLTSLFGFFFLVFVATTLVDMIKRTINFLWDMKIVAPTSFLSLFKERAISFLLIMLDGGFFLFSLLLDAFLSIISNSLSYIDEGLHVNLVRALNIIFSSIITAFWFSIIFKWLPSARLPWKPALVGGLFTGILFEAGKFILGKVLIHGNVSLIFGASGSLALLLLFVFYASLIFYFGAMFTKNFGEAINKPPVPGIYAAQFEEVIIKESYTEEIS